MERFHSASPDISSFAFSWRKRTIRPPFPIPNREDKSCLTSSLPSAVLSKEMEESKSPKYRTSQFPQNEIIQEGTHSRPRSTIYEGEKLLH